MEQTTIKTPKNTAALQPKAAGAVAKNNKSMTVRKWFADATFQKQISNALPEFMRKESDTFIRNALTDFNGNKMLHECTVKSVLGYYLEAAACGLMPGTTLGHCYAVPFKEKNDEMNCVFILGYRGMLAIARRSGEVASVEAKAVYEKDTIEVIDGMESDIKHTRFMGGDRGAFVGAYCIVRFKDKEIRPVMEYMSKYEIDKHRKRSKASNSGPWVTDYDEMAKKTVFRSIFKWLPISIEQIQATTTDGAVADYKMGNDSENIDDLLEIKFVDDEANDDYADESPAQDVDAAVDAMAEQMGIEA